MAERRDALASVLTALLLASLVTLPFALFTGLFGVQFAQPVGFVLAAIAIPLLLLYMLRARRPRRRVASILFWQPIALEQQATSPFKRLRRNLVLLLQLLALAALIYGVARPVMQAGSSQGSSLIVILDASASMQTRDVDGRTRFDAARAAALDLAKGMGPRDQITIIAADRTAWTVVPWTHDEAAVERGLRKLRPRHTGTALAEGLVLAASARRAASGEPEFHLLSDGGGPTPPPMALGGPLIYRAFGESEENLGIVAIEARPRLKKEDAPEDEEGAPDALGYEVFATVLNAGPASRDVFVSLEAAGRPLAARRLTVPAGGEQPVVLEARLRPGPIAVRLLPAEPGSPVDAFAVDDVAHALIPEERGVAVGLVSAEPSPALERAVEAAGGRLRVIPPGAFRDDPDLRLMIFEGSVPETLPPRDCLFVAPRGTVGPIAPGARVSELRAAGWDRDDDVLRYVDLEDLEVSTGTALTVGGGARALLQGETADGDGATLIAAWEEGSASRVVVGFDIYRSSWPLRASFPIFIRNCLLAAAERDQLAQGGLPAGVPLPIPVGTEVQTVSVEAPDGQVDVVGAWAGYAYFGGARLTGVYTATAGERRERFCVNLTDADESRIAPRPTFEVGETTAADAPPPLRPTEVARWFAMVALVVLVIEFWVYHRRLD